MLTTQNKKEIKMKQQNLIEFKCIDCGEIISFPLLEIENNANINCHSCEKEYIFNTEFLNKLKKFAKLILSVREAKDILGSTNVAINVEEHAVKIPYRVLLTRLNTLITLEIGGEKIDFSFRVEPLKE